MIERDVAELDLYANLAGDGRGVEGVTEFRRRRKPQARADSAALPALPAVPGRRHASDRLDGVAGRLRWRRAADANHAALVRRVAEGFAVSRDAAAFRLAKLGYVAPEAAA